MSIFRSDSRYIYLEIPYCEFYIPEYYFDSKWAERRQDSIYSMGIFTVGIFEDGKLKELKTLNLPSQMNFYIYESETRNVDLPGNPNTKCTVLKYIKGQKVMDSYIIEDSANAAMFVDMIIKGKVPSTVPYSKVLSIWMTNQELNSVNFGVPSTTLEMILAVAYRDRNNIGRKFSQVIGADLKVSEWDYKMARIRQICQYGSTFTAMTFEDFNSMLTTSLNRSRRGDEEMESPVEKIIKY